MDGDPPVPHISGLSAVWLLGVLVEGHRIVYWEDDLDSMESLLFPGSLTFCEFLFS